jgi:hypothetical protein
MAEFGRFKRFQMFNGLAVMFGFGRFGGCLLAEFGRFKRFQMFNGLAVMFGFGRFGTCLPAGV